MSAQWFACLESPAIPCTTIAPGDPRLLEELGHDLVLDGDGHALALLFIVFIEGVEEVEIGMQVDVFGAVERSASKNLECETDTSSQCNLVVSTSFSKGRALVKKRTETHDTIVEDECSDAPVARQKH